MIKVLPSNNNFKFYFFQDLRAQRSTQNNEGERALVYKERQEQLQKICEKYNLITKGHAYHLKWNIYFYPHYQVKFIERIILYQLFSALKIIFQFAYCPNGKTGTMVWMNYFKVKVLDFWFKSLKTMVPQGIFKLLINY